MDTVAHLQLEVEALKFVQSADPMTRSTVLFVYLGRLARVRYATSLCCSYISPPGPDDDGAAPT